jgi:prolyl oligopeptidase
VRTEENVGHGARSLSKSIEESADTLAFMSHWTGLDH